MLIILLLLSNLKVNSTEALPDIIKAFNFVGCVEYWWRGYGEGTGPPQVLL